MRKPAFCICENKDTDQLRGNREADQRLCFRYTDSTKASCHLVWLYSPVCVGSGRKPRRPVFSQRGSFMSLVLTNMSPGFQVCFDLLACFISLGSLEILDIKTRGIKQSWQ